MKYEEPEMNVIYLEESTHTLVEVSSGTGGEVDWGDIGKSSVR